MKAVTVKAGVKTKQWVCSVYNWFRVHLTHLVPPSYTVLNNVANKNTA